MHLAISPVLHSQRLYALAVDLSGTVKAEKGADATWLEFDVDAVGKED